MNCDQIEKIVYVVALMAVVMSIALLIEDHVVYSTDEISIPVVAPRSNNSESTINTVIINIRGLRWIGDPSNVSIMSKLGSEIKYATIPAEKGDELYQSFKFTNVTIPTGFLIKMSDEIGEVLALEGEVARSTVRVTRVIHDQNKVTPHGDVLVELIFIGRFFAVELDLPIKGEIDVESRIDETLVNVEMEMHENMVKVIINDVMFTNESSTFIVFVRSSQQIISTIRGVVSITGLKEIAVEGGVIETLKAKTVIKTGSAKTYVPTRILDLRFVAGEAVQFIRSTDVIINSTEVVMGNVPVRLLAYRKGSWFQRPEMIPGAVFEVKLLRYNVTKVYGNNETAYMPRDEEVLVKAIAEGYISKESKFKVSNETREVIFYLEEINKSPLRIIEEAIASLLASRFFIPIMLGVIVALLIILISRRG